MDDVESEDQRDAVRGFFHRDFLQAISLRWVRNEQQRPALAISQIRLDVQRNVTGFFFPLGQGSRWLLMRIVLVEVEVLGELACLLLKAQASQKVLDTIVDR